MILIAYAVCALIVMRAVAGHTAYSMAFHDDEPEGIDWFSGILVGLAAGLVWPVVLVAVLAGRVKVFALGAERASIDKTKRLQQQREAEESKRKLRELEALLDRELTQ